MNSDQSGVVQTSSQLANVLKVIKMPLGHIVLILGESACAIWDSDKIDYQIRTECN